MLKTRACGFFTPLSGGADSGITSMFLYNMCKKILNSNKEIKDEFSLITGFEFKNNTKV